ncbi:hypothetical protein SUGI_0447500 [Cryptomeria japonica]|nr:hypothetical protein SUGI_0447500 [Cryptomeria japonica]
MKISQNAATCGMVYRFTWRPLFLRMGGIGKRTHCWALDASERNSVYSENQVAEAVVSKILNRSSKF